MSTPNNSIPYVPEGTLDPAAGLNDSLDVIDALLQTAVIAMDLSSPPGTPIDGDLYIVAGAGSGAWAGLGNYLVRYRSEGNFWQSFAPGTQIKYVLNLDDGKFYRYQQTDSPAGWVEMSGTVDQSADYLWTGFHEWNSNGAASAGIEVWRDDGLLQANITSTGYALQGGGTFHANFARGSRASPSAAQAGDITGGIGSRVHNGSGFQTSSPAAIHWQVTENAGGSNAGMWLRFLTTPKGSTTRQERGGITDNGTFWSHDTGTYDATLSAQTLPVSDARFVASADSSAGATGCTYVAVGYGAGGGAGVSPGLRGMGARGTPASPSASQSGDLLAFMGCHGHDGTSFSAGTKALIGFMAAENWGASANGTLVSIEATPIGSTSRAQVGQFDGNATADNTRFMLYDVSAGALVRVSRGASDSGGSGFRVLRIPN